MSLSNTDPTIDGPVAVADVTRTHLGTDGGPPRDAPADFAPPGYEILGELGRGGMGVVYRARHRALNRLVALKVILGAGHAGKDQLARFRAEATTAAQLQHPNIVQVFEVGEHHGQPFFSLELVEGGSLADYLKGEPQPPAEAAYLVRTLALAVHHAHERGVVHRDLKPANVLLGNDERGATNEEQKTLTGSHSSLITRHSSLRPKVTDFGLAKQQASGSDLTASGAVLGTPSYMAPEQAAGKTHDIGFPADVYALGAILYECLTGRPPFRGPTVMDTVLQVMSDEPVPPSRLQPKVPRDLETIGLKCLAKKPDARYATAADLADDLGRFLTGEPVLARPASAVTRAWKWARRHPAIAVVGFVFAVPLPLLLAVMVYLWAEGRTARRVAEEEKAAAVASRDEADRERALAQGYLKSALSTMDKVMERIGDDRMMKVAAIQEDRTAILADTVAFYESLLRLDSAEPMVRAQTAEVYARVGRIALMGGDIDRSGRSSRAAIDLLTALAAEHPERAEYREALARHYVFYGHSRVLNGDFDQGLKAYEEGAALAEDLVRAEPGEPAPQRAAAEARRSLGYYYAMQNAPLALDQFRAAVEDVAGLPDTPDDRALTAHVFGAYGAFLMATPARRAEAEAFLRRGLALLDKPLSTRGAGRMSAEIAGLTIRTVLATLCLQTNRREEGGRLLARAIADLEARADGPATAFPYRIQAVSTYQLQSQGLEIGRNWAGAAAAGGKALAVCDALMADVPAFREFPKGLWMQQTRMRVMTRYTANLVRAGHQWETLSLIAGPVALTAAQPASAGHRSNALRLIAEADAAPGLGGPIAYDVACVLGLAARDARPLSREVLSRRAVAWLEKANATGYPDTPKAIASVGDDWDLMALRGRADFEAYRAGLGKK